MTILNLALLINAIAQLFAAFAKIHQRHPAPKMTGLRLLDFANKSAWALSAAAPVGDYCRKLLIACNDFNGST